MRERRDINLRILALSELLFDPPKVLKVSPLFSNGVFTTARPFEAGDEGKGILRIPVLCTFEQNSLRSEEGMTKVFVLINRGSNTASKHSSTREKGLGIGDKEVGLGEVDGGGRGEGGL